MLDYEYYFKMLIAANYLGIYITSQDGHRWIESEPTDYFDFEEYLRLNKIALNNKIYGGVTNALKTINEVFRTAEGKSIFDKVIEIDEYEIGNGNLENNRIDINCTGGLF